MRIKGPVGLSSICRPAVARVERYSEVAPFDGVCLAQDDGSCLSKLPRNCRVSGHLGPDECIGSGCVVHSIVCGDLVQRAL